nr:MAG TPA: hypothetical protein [Caudoviricetes sp.]
MKNKQQTPQRNLRRFALWGGPGKRTFRFTRRNTSFYFFGTLRFADYTSEQCQADVKGQIPTNKRKLNSKQWKRLIDRLR